MDIHVCFFNRRKKLLVCVNVFVDAYHHEWCWAFGIEIVRIVMKVRTGLARMDAPWWGTDVQASCFVFWFLADLQSGRIQKLS